MWEKCAIDLPVESSAAQESPEVQAQDRELMGRRLSYAVVRRRIFEGASTALVLELAGETLLLRVAGPLVVGEGEEVPIGVVGPALAFPAEA